MNYGDTRHEEDRYALRVPPNSMKVNGYRKYCIACGPLKIDQKNWKCGRAEPIIRATSQFGTLVQQHCLAMLTVFRSRISFLSFLYQFQLAIDFVTGLLGEECFFSVFFFPFSEDYIKRKEVGIACGYCILCTTMPRINWLLLKLRCCCFCFFSKAFSLTKSIILLQFDSLFAVIHCGHFASPHL